MLSDGFVGMAIPVVLNAQEPVRVSLHSILQSHPIYIFGMHRFLFFYFVYVMISLMFCIVCIYFAIGVTLLLTVDPSFPSTEAGHCCTWGGRFYSRSDLQNVNS